MEIGAGFVRTFRSSGPLNRKSGKMPKIAAHVLAIVGLYLAFSGALFLGLQVDVVHGSIAAVIAILMIVLYIYFGFMRK